jgi:NDP-sugar pyrophosphorylase family protein
LIPFFQKPLISYAFDHLVDAGVTEIMVNTHHAAHRYREALLEGRHGSAQLHFRHEETLLETGGGIKNIEDFVGSSTFYVYNGDTLTDLKLSRLQDAHLDSKAVATLALRTKDGPLKVSMAPGTNEVVDIGELMNSGVEPRFLFTGQYILGPEIFDFLDEGKVESVVHALIRMMRCGLRVQGVVCDDGHWFDLGSRGSLLAAHSTVAGLDIFPSYASGARPVLRHETSLLEAGVELVGSTVLGRNTHVKGRARLTNTLVFPDGIVGQGCILEECIIGHGIEVPAFTIAEGRDFGS